MSTPPTPTPPRPDVRPSQPHCPSCGAALAADQRYCLNCGRRLTHPRVEFREALGLAPKPVVTPPRPGFWDQRGALITLAAIACVVVALGVGIVIGRGNGATTVAASKPTIVTVPSSAPASTAAAATPASATTVTDGWAAGASGWTVELSTLDNAGAQASDVTAAESAASAKGAPAVGVLNGDNHTGTPTGKYVIYSGRYSSHQQAQAAKAKLKNNFPGAIVLHVTPLGSGNSASAGNSKSKSTGASSAQVANLHKLSGSAYVKASAKLPSTVTSSGPPPPKDNKKPGGGTSGSCIGC